MIRKLNVVIEVDVPFKTEDDFGLITCLENQVRGQPVQVGRNQAMVIKSVQPAKQEEAP